ncbi:peptidogalycan biosysnthesis protein [Polaribacter septentrionalilitoris]|uniref:peptidogalycan biosysnthesis protein n=1 Tax=Polaribacter septentrionalilitoris TaxID=2494657 RepID=UPI00135B76B9|nr:GNAT family N-acetyltransferase [Polaribacter septentrionalilitoris]
MKFCSNTNNASFFASVDDISEDIWQILNCENNIYFHRDFLKSIEKNHPKILFSYIVLNDENKQPIALASVQIVDFYINGIKNDLESFLKKIEQFARKIHLFPSKKPLRLLICGNTFVSGEHGVFIKKNNDKKKVIKKLAKSISHLSNSNKSLKADAYLLKDFTNESLFITNELKEYYYHPFLVEPNMVLKIDEQWHSFDDYLAAMKTKFRVKARKAFKQSLSLRIEEVTLKNIEDQLPEMTTLYQKVANNADFNLGTFNLASYKNLKEKLGENYILKTYWLEDKIVGFISGIVSNTSLDAHFVGIDYSLNRTYAIYQRMLYDYIEIAINKKLKTLNYGRTASEIKSSVGAYPQDLTMYLRHKKTITNKILKLFLQRVQPTPFQQKFPFKKIELVNEK